MAEYPGNEQVGLDFETIALARMQTHSNLSFVVSELDSGNVVDTTLRPNLHFYLPTGIDWDDYDDTVARLFASSRGGIELNGARRNDRTFRLYGPYDSTSGPYELDIAPPGAPSAPRYYLMRTGFAPPPIGLLERRAEGIGDVAPLMVDASVGPDGLTSEPSPMSAATFGGQCVDDLDNDGDGYNDGCDFDCVVHPDFGGLDFDYAVQYEQTKNFAIIGDGPFCMENANNWESGPCRCRNDRGHDVELARAAHGAASRTSSALCVGRMLLRVRLVRRCG